MNSSPPGNQEVGGPDREGSGCSSAQAGGQSLDEWEFVWCLGADGERFLYARHPEPSERTRQTGFAAEHTAAAGLYFVNFCSLLCVSRRVSVSTEETGRALCWIGLHRSTQPSAHRHTNPLGSCLFPLKDISNRRIYARSHCVRSRERRGGSRDLCPPRSLSSPQCCCRSFRWRDTWFPLSKRRSSFVNGSGSFFLGRLLLAAHGCPQFKRSRLRRLSCGLYYLKSRM